MAEDPEEKREIASTFGEYIGSVKESYRVYKWVWDELITDEAKRWSRNMLFWFIIAMLMFSAKPFIIGLLITDLVAGDTHALMWHLALLATVSLINKFTDHKTNVAREYIIGINWGVLKNRTTEMFLEKSLGQHMQENDILNVPNMDKGQQKTESVMFILLFEGINMMLMLLVSAVFLFLLQPIAGGILLAILVMYAGCSLYLNRRVIEVCTPIDAEVRKFNRHRMGNIWERVQRVLTSNKAEEETELLWNWFNRILDDDRRFWLSYINLNDLRELIAELSWVGIVAFGVWSVVQGNFEVGMLYPLAQWSGRAIFNTKQMSWVEQQLNWNMPSVRSMMQALTLEPDVKDVEDPVVLTPDEPVSLELRGVSHAYRGRNADEKVAGVLKDVSLHIRPGEKIAIIGATGSGKTTITRLTQRFADPEKGAVIACGHDLRNIELASWRRLIGFVDQEALIFDGTIRSNLTYGLTTEELASITDDDLWRVMRILQIDFGSRLTDGLETKVGRNGIKLSGGEKQRIAIGAAILKNPRFFIADEATASLDALTERKVQEGFAKLLPTDATAMFITHRLATVRHICNRFYMLRKIDDLENGDSQIEAVADSFEELYGLSPTFRELADLQGLHIAN